MTGAPGADAAALAGGLAALGFGPWVEARAAGLCPPGCRVARVCAVDRGACLLRDGAGEALARLSGRLEFFADGPDDLPCVGDWVAASFHGDGAQALVHAVLPRRSALRRRAPGGGGGQQMIAANVDTAFIVQACGRDFNPARLERYLVMAADGGVEPVVLLTKADLATGAELDAARAGVRAVARAEALAVSSVTGVGLDALRRALVPGRTYCLLGSSGVGKTTLINGLLGHEAFATRAVSASGEGVHTTTRRQLVALAGGALLVDTPGMRELGVAGAEGGLDAGFAELAALAGACRYADCRHEGEPGCAVRAAVEAGEVPRERYASYLKLRREAEFRELSDLGRRRRDKAFGRLVKSVKKAGRSRGR